MVADLRTPASRVAGSPSPAGGTPAPSPERSGAAAALAELGLTPATIARLPRQLQWNLATRARAAGALDLAGAVLDVIAARMEDGVKVVEERARLAFAAGRPAEALHLMRQRVARAPSVTARVGLGRLLLETGGLEEAIAVSRDLLRAEPDSLAAGALAAEIAWARGDRETARAHYLGAVDLRPDNAPALLALARLALEEEDAESAERFLRRALAASAEEPAAHTLQTAAAVAAGLGDEPRAVDLRRRAAAIESARFADFLTTLREALAKLSTDASPAPRPVRPRTERADRAPVEPTPAPPAEEPAEPAPAFDAPIEEAPELDPTVVDGLRRHFGHDALRPGQAAVIARVMARRDTLAIMPTGAGKSLTFQLPAMLLEGATLVISPLIALMQDQVDSLPPAVQARTTLVNSTLGGPEMRRRLEEVAAGTYKLIYVAPERLRHHAFLAAMRAAGVALVVVDEAHCISMWGHDFRPDYLSIPKALPELGDPPVLAVTATATATMSAQIATALGRRLDLVRTSIFRPNLFYEVQPVRDREAKVARALEICRRERGPGIVYVASRRDAEMIAGRLRQSGENAVAYHAGLDPSERAMRQERFMAGRVRIVVATVAFGMGVDKRDVRFIVHLSPPNSLEAYAQESGRAGRDKRRARCVLLIAPSDKATLNRHAARDELDLDTLRRVYAGIKRAAAGEWAITNPSSLVPHDPDDGDGDIDTRVALGILEQAALLVRHPDAPVSYALRPLLVGRDQRPIIPAAPAGWDRLAPWIGADRLARGGLIQTADACAATGLTPRELDRLLAERPDLEARPGPRAVCLQLLPVRNDATAALTQLLERAHEDARRRIRQVIAYATSGRCRHQMLAAHLGERLPPCGTACDVCTGAVAFPDAGDDATERRTAVSARDALAVLETVGGLPFPMGRTGLAKFLAGSVESRVRPDRAPGFGTLKGLPKGKIEDLIDRLVDDGFLYRNLAHEFKVITLTERGADATLADLASYEQAAPTPRPSKPTSPAKTAIAPDAGDLDPAAADLLDRLKQWRRARASADAVPPYVIAHDSTLRNLAVARPATVAALLTVPGFGPARVEKYGPELLELIAEE